MSFEDIDPSVQGVAHEFKALDKGDKAEVVRWIRKHFASNHITEDVIQKLSRKDTVLFHTTVIWNSNRGVYFNFCFCQAATGRETRGRSILLPIKFISGNRQAYTPLSVVSTHHVLP